MGRNEMLLCAAKARLQLDYERKWFYVRECYDEYFELILRRS